MSLRSIARDLVRRGPRCAVLIPEWAGFGNQLYYYFHVDRLQRAGVDAFAVPNLGGTAWLEHFPAIRDALTRARAEVRRTDRIDQTDWDALGGFGIDYSREDLRRFVDRYLLSAPALTHLPSPSSTLTVNVRRGDYFTNPTVRGVLGFDQPAYIAAALERHLRDRPAPQTISVISDDPGWCAIRLSFLRDHTQELVFNEPDSRPIDDFCAVAGASDLIITNSTFSVWAAHVSSARRGEKAGRVIAPSFGVRPHTGQWRPLDPEWTTIEDIPGGWDS